MNDYVELAPGWFMARTAETDREYGRYRYESRADECSLCSKIEPGDVVEKTKHLIVVKNMFPYYIYENQPVREHLMIVPKRHIFSLKDFTDDEAQEYLQILLKYEPQNYTIYSRAADNSSRSQPHLHTHLIKVF